MYVCVGEVYEVIQLSQVSKRTQEINIQECEYLMRWLSLLSGNGDKSNGEQLVACFGNNDGDVLPNEEGEERHVSLPVPILDIPCDYIEFNEQL